MKKDTLSEIKSEIKSIKKDIKKDIQNSDAESLEENFYALMDCHNRMRNHFKESISQLSSENEESVLYAIEELNQTRQVICILIVH